MKAVKRFHKRVKTRLFNQSQKSFYNYINKKLKLKSVIPAILDDTGSICFEDIEKANDFMHVFKEVFTVDNGQLPIFPDKNVECDYNAIDLHNANKQSAAGPDGFPGLLWSNLASSLSLPLSIIFNVSFATGMLPSIWKLSYISPIHKKGINLILIIIDLLH